MAGPKQNMKLGWSLLRKGLPIGKETPVGLFLGCRHILDEVVMPDNRIVRSITYDMSDFLQSCVDVYLSLAEEGTRLRKVGTPFLPEDQSESEAGAPVCDGPVVECTWCAHTFSPTIVESVEQLPKATTTAGPSAEAEDGPLTVSNDAKTGERITSKPIAAKVLVKVLFAARMARFDLLRAVYKLARSITKWNSSCGKRLHRLMCYIYTAKD